MYVDVFILSYKYKPIENVFHETRKICFHANISEKTLFIHSDCLHIGMYIGFKA